MDAKALGLHSFIVASATALFAGSAGAQEPPGAAPPSQPAVSVTLGESASTGATAPSTPAADTGSSSAPSDEHIDKNPANYEFAFVSVGAYQTWSIAGRVLFFGAGGGLGPALYRVGKLKEMHAGAADVDHELGWNPNLDIVYGNVFLRVSPIEYVDVDIGPKIAIGATLFDVPDAPESAFSYGGYADLRVGSRTVKLGPRFEYMKIAHSNFYETGWILTPLMLRVTH